MNGEEIYFALCIHANHKDRNGSNPEWIRCVDNVFGKLKVVALLR
jgi:hypothetical protein